MAIRYVHTNIIAADWEALAAFYIAVFDCERLSPDRDLSGAWLSKATGVEDAALKGVHLRLPGHGDRGPTLEIFSYAAMAEKGMPRADRKGFGHLAFEVEDVAAMTKRVLDAGGQAIGEAVSLPVPGAGVVTFVYVTDPEGNILELQSWSPAP